MGYSFRAACGAIHVKQISVILIMGVIKVILITRVTLGYIGQLHTHSFRCHNECPVAIYISMIHSITK